MHGIQVKVLSLYHQQNNNQLLLLLGMGNNKNFMPQYVAISSE